MFIPVRGGELTIIDPAGSYLTHDFFGYITSNPAYQELRNYSNHWSSNGGIKTIKIYTVNVYSGDYKLLISGSMSDIASYIENITK